MDKKTAKKKIISPLDVFAVLFIVLCLASALLRLTFDFGDGSGGKVDEGDYLISYKVEALRTTSTVYFDSGTEFFVAETGELFGTTEGVSTVTPGEYYSEDPDGKLTVKYYPENGDESLVDIKGTMRVKGYRESETGLFRLDDGMILTPNTSVSLKSNELLVVVTVTAINKVS